MKELIHLKGQYAKWDHDKRESVPREFIQVIKHFTLFPFGIALNVEAWRNLPQEVRHRYGKAQHFCFLNLIARVGALLHSVKRNDFIHIVTDTDPYFAKPRFDLFSWVKSHDPKMRQMARSFTGISGLQG